MGEIGRIEIMKVARNIWDQIREFEQVTGNPVLVNIGNKTISVNDLVNGN